MGSELETEPRFLPKRPFVWFRSPARWTDAAGPSPE